MPLVVRSLVIELMLTTTAPGSFVRGDTPGQFARHPPDAFQVRIDHHVPAVVVERDEGVRARFDAGVVDENVDRAEVFLRRVEERGHALQIGYIEGRGERLAPGGAYLRHAFVEFRHGTRAENNLRAGGRQRAGHVAADAGGRAGQRGHFSS